MDEPLPDSELYITHGLYGSEFALLRENRKFIDIYLKSGDHKIPAHRIMLYSRIPYFRSGIMNEIPSDPNYEIEINEVAPELLEIFVEYAYTGVFNLIPERVFEMLLAARFLQLDDVREFCRLSIESLDLLIAEPIRTRE